MVGFAPLIRPTYAEANVGHPSSSYWVLLGGDSCRVDQKDESARSRLSDGIGAFGLK
jgi:hypothetical protein